MSFTLDDISEELFNKTVFFEYESSSGLGGSGCIRLLTSEGEEYLLGFEGFEYSEDELYKFFPIADKSKELDGWEYFYAADITMLIREGFYKQFIEAYENAKEKSKYVFGFEIVKKMLDPENKIPRNVYVGTEKALQKKAAEMEEQEKQRALVRLTDEDIYWETLYMNNMKQNPIIGYYLLMFKKEEDGSITGSKWSIIFQLEEISPCCESPNSQIEAYNLFYETYYKVKGPLKYPEPTENCMLKYDSSTLNDIQSYGQFIHSYKTLQAAKEGALYRNEFVGWGNYNKRNLIRVKKRVM